MNPHFALFLSRAPYATALSCTSGRSRTGMRSKMTFALHLCMRGGEGREREKERERKREREKERERETERDREREGGDRKRRKDSP